ncbi:hypothetical protein IWQ61_006160 [Dispira simplex]|nr:hypothetical protein IWQ61_006160 [Dispira simplex]
MSQAQLPVINVAPSISKLRVITMWRRLPSQEVWFRIEVTPMASLETTARDSRVWIDPKKQGQSVANAPGTGSHQGSYALDHVYYIQRTFTHCLYFYRHFCESLGNRDDIRRSLPRLVDRRSLISNKEKDTQRRMDLLNDFFKHMMQWPQQVAQSRVVADFFGVWYCDVHDLNNNSHLPSPAQDLVRLPQRSNKHPSTFENGLGQRAYLKPPPRVNQDTARTEKPQEPAQPSVLSTPQTVGGPRRVGKLVDPGRRRSRSLMDMKWTGPESIVQEKGPAAVPAPVEEPPKSTGFSLKHSKSLRNLRRLASFKFSRKAQQPPSPDSESPSPSLKGIRLLPNGTLGPNPNCAGTPLADSQSNGDLLGHVRVSPMSQAPRIPTMVIPASAGDLGDLQYELSKVDPIPSPIASDNEEDQVIIRGRWGNMLQRANTTGKLYKRAKASRLQKLKLTGDADRNHQDDSPPTPPPPRTSLLRRYNTLGSSAQYDSRKLVQGGDGHASQNGPLVGSGLQRSASTSQRFHNTVQLRMYQDDKMLMTIPVLRSAGNRPSSPRARCNMLSPSIEFSRIYTSILRHLHAMGSECALELSKQIQSFVLAYDVPDKGQVVARTEEEIVKAIHNGPATMACRVETGRLTSNVAIVGEAIDPTTQDGKMSSPSMTTKGKDTRASPAPASSPYSKGTPILSLRELSRGKNETVVDGAQRITLRRFQSQRIVTKRSPVVMNMTNPKHQLHADYANSEPTSPVLTLDHNKFTGLGSVDVATPTFGVGLPSEDAQLSGSPRMGRAVSQIPPARTRGEISFNTTVPSSAEAIASSSNESLHRGYTQSKPPRHPRAAPVCPPANLALRRHASSPFLRNQASGTQRVGTLSDREITPPATPPLTRRPTVSKSYFVMQQRYLRQMDNATDAPQADHNIGNRLINASVLHLKIILNENSRIMLAIPRTAVYSVLWDKVVTKFSKAGEASLAKLKTMCLTYIWEDRFEIINDNASWRNALQLVDKVCQQLEPSPVVSQSNLTLPKAEGPVSPAPRDTSSKPMAFGTLARSLSVKASRGVRRLDSTRTKRSDGNLAARAKASASSPTTRMDTTGYQPFISRSRSGISSRANSPLPPTPASVGLSPQNQLGDPRGMESVGKLILYLVPNDMLKQSSGRRAMLVNIPDQLVESGGVDHVPGQHTPVDAHLPSTLDILPHGEESPSSSAPFVSDSYFPLQLPESQPTGISIY